MDMSTLTLPDNQGAKIVSCLQIAKDPDMESLIIDTTIVRAHPCASGALKTGGGQTCQALGHSRGGFSTKIHINVPMNSSRLSQNAKNVAFCDKLARIRVITGFPPIFPI